jgi:hypothetical protein
MAQQIKRKFILNDSINEEKILLGNNGALRARNAADSADVDLFKLDGSDVLKLLKLPRADAALAAPSDAKDLATKEYVDGEITDNVTNQLGAVNGIATLDANGKLSSGQVPSIAITDVFVVADIAARDALTGIEEGDVAKVSDAGAGLPKTYIYDGSQWIEIESGSDVDSVNGEVGAVILTAGDIDLDTAIRSETEVQAALAKLDTDLGTAESAISALEGASVEFVQEKFTLSAGDITNGYVTLANLAIAASVNPFVDRLAIHETDDYTLSTVGGVTRVTFAGSLITVGQEKLSAGDVVRVKYAKVAIV